MNNITIQKQANESDLHYWIKKSVITRGSLKYQDIDGFKILQNKNAFGELAMTLGDSAIQPDIAYIDGSEEFYIEAMVTNDIAKCIKVTKYDPKHCIVINFLEVRGIKSYEDVNKLLDTGLFAMTLEKYMLSK